MLSTSIWDIEYSNLGVMLDIEQSNITYQILNDPMLDISDITIANPAWRGRRYAEDQAGSSCVCNGPDLQLPVPISRTSAAMGDADIDKSGHWGVALVNGSVVTRKMQYRTGASRARPDGSVGEERVGGGGGGGGGEQVS